MSQENAMKISDQIREAAKPVADLKVKFPSHALMDLDEKVYKKFDDFHRQYHKQLTPEQDQKFEKALRTFVTLLAQLKDAERSLYR
jgi:uncharacterized protein YeaO (DUF488 family)